MARCHAKQYLRAFIADNHCRINEYNWRIRISSERLSALIPENIRARFNNKMTEKMNSRSDFLRRRLECKYDSLTARNQRVPERRWINNLSSRQLSADEEAVLGKGLNYSTVHRKSDTVNLIASIEPTVSQLKIDQDQKNVIRQEMANAVQNAPKCDNLTSTEKEALRKLKEDNSIVITQADKGNATVVMDKVDYEKKIEDHLLDNNTYREVQRDPTKTLQNKVNSELKALKDFSLLSDKTYSVLRSRTASIPLFYALVKIHKENNPIRPIVSFNSSPTYELAKHLSKVLTPITNKSQHKLKNTIDAKNFLSHQVIPHDYSLVSFDVKSLFTSIPQDLAMDCVKDALENDDELTDRTALNTSEVCSLTQLCLQSTTFKWNNRYFKQIKGTPMGSPISVVLAELTMQNFETTALRRPPCNILFWKRYVDDIITAVPTDKIETLLAYLNALNNHIQFTVEKEENSSIPFLDLFITRNDDGHLQFSVHRKPTHTGKYLNYNSYNPSNHKASVASTLFTRAKQICEGEKKREEEKIIIDELKMNDYPMKLIKQCYKRANRTSNQQPAAKNNTFISAPYIKGASERIGRILKRHDIQLAHKPSQKIKNQLSHVKDRRTTGEKSAAVYKIPCTDCDSCYIGETGREVNVRVAEHRKNVDQCAQLSLVYQHVRDFQHSMAWDEVTVIGDHTNTYSRKFLEACHSMNNPRHLNRSVNVPPPYARVIKENL
jgi:hypothetical protein